MSDRQRLAHLIKSTQQHRVLVSMASAYGWTLGAEIGVLRGKTLFALLDAVHGLTMYGIDQWKRLPLRADENAETYTDFDMDALFEQVAIRSLRYGDRCRILSGDSVAMAGEVDDGALDFVFIDGDHTEFGVERDLLAWTPKVKDYGLVLGHDCHWLTVRRVLDRRCSGWKSEGEAVWSIPKARIAL